MSAQAALLAYVRAELGLEDESEIRIEHEDDLIHATSEAVAHMGRYYTVRTPRGAISIRVDYNPPRVSPPT